MNAKSCIALVLAGGFGRRFGRDKRAARFSDEQTLIAASVKHIDSIFSQRRVVLRRGDVPANLGLSRETEIIYSDQSERGLGASLAVGVAELQTSDADAVAIFLGDMPWISSHTQKCLFNKPKPAKLLSRVIKEKRGTRLCLAVSFGTSCSS
ncbi:NTP transferase domain-containing protein [Vibrio olivae]